MTDDQLREYIRRGRERACKYGSMHPGWDLIVDAEELLRGRPAMLGREKIETAFREWLD